MVTVPLLQFMRHLLPAISLVYLLAGICLPFNYAQAAQTIELNEESSGKFLGEYLYYLEDKDKQYSIEQIQSPEIDKQFKASKLEIPNLGFADSRYWLKLEVMDKSNYVSKQDASMHLDAWQGNQWIIEFVYPPMDHISIFRPDGLGGYEEVKSGEFVTIDNREFIHHQFLFHLKTIPNEKQTIYFAVAGKSSMQFPIKIWRVNDFVTYDTQRTLINGLFFGIMFVMAAYNLFLYFSVRDKTYLLYIGYILSIVCYFGSFAGYNQAYLWPNNPELGSVGIPLFAATGLFFCNLFSKLFLSTKQNIPRIDKVLTFFLWVSVFTIGVCALDVYLFAVGLVIFNGILFSALILVGSIICLINKHRMARFFVIAWGSLLIGLVLQGLAVIDILPVNFITMHFAQIGCVLEVILLSFALADRINLLQQQNEIFQKQTVDALSKSNELKDQFLATISHELRTPMNGIQSSLSLINQKELSKENDEFVNVARHSADHMLDLIESILGFTEAQSKRMVIKSETFNCRELFDGLARKMETLAKEKSIGFTYQFSKTLPDTILGDEKLIKNVVVPLLDNAVKFTERGSVRFAVALQRTTTDIEQNQTPRLEIRIEDTGIGVKEEKAAEIFDLFNQQDGSFHRNYGGLGIGLSTAKSLVNLLNGQFNFASTLDEGTQIAIALPIKLDESNIPSTQDDIENSSQSQQNNSNSSSAQESLTSTKLLVVEDNLVNQKVLVKLLEKIGFECEIANNGQEALQQIEKQTPQLILMDCQMPIMDGFEATAAIRALGLSEQQLPIIAVTANAMSCDEERCLDSGMNDYMTKPVKKDLLAEKLEYWIKISKSAKSA